MLATVELVEAAGASVASIVAVRVHHTERTELLFEQYDVHSLG